MANSPYIIEVNEENFADIIINGSENVPVVVDFWADWCAPCKSLMPILESLAEQYNGRFILAKINSDENQNIVSQIGIRSLPTVKLFKAGQPVDEFMGALPESEVRAFIDKHLDPAEDNTQETSNIDSAMLAFEQGDIETAKTLLTEEYNKDANNTQTALALGQVCMAAGDYESAELVLNNLSDDASSSSEGLRLKGMLTLSQADTSGKSLEELADLVNSDNSSENRYLYAIKLALQNQIQESLDQLLSLMQDDREFADDGARKCLITLFDVLGNDPLVGQYRRKMFNTLH